MALMKGALLPFPGLADSLEPDRPCVVVRYLENDKDGNPVVLIRDDLGRYWRVKEKDLRSDQA